ncbi:hypothetical protein [Thioclava pacifica]|uniref:hypothetical protein n=1 Tax=Thioclava pacifica TaxID=285109 RepID=UPI0012F940D6|nr:hypothetical protein [Thioclava pacifica]
MIALPACAVSPDFPARHARQAHAKVTLRTGKVSPVTGANTVALTTTISANAANCAVALDVLLRTIETEWNATRIKNVFFRALAPAGRSTTTPKGRTSTTISRNSRAFRGVTRS